jgi:hypothetical protein
MVIREENKMGDLFLVEVVVELDFNGKEPYMNQASKY